MSLILQATIVNKDTGQVEKVHVLTVDGRDGSWEAARCIRLFLGNVFRIFFGPDCDDEW